MYLRDIWYDAKVTSTYLGKAPNQFVRTPNLLKCHESKITGLDRTTTVWLAGWIPAKSANCVNCCKVEQTNQSCCPIGEQLPGCEWLPNRSLPEWQVTDSKTIRSTAPADP